MKKIALIVAAALAISSLAFAGCGKSGAPVITIENENASLAAEGKTMTLDLTGIPSTGYEWTCEIDQEDLLAEKSHETEEAANDSSEPMVGTSVTEHYTFEAAGDGEVRLTAKYARSWETSADDIEYVYLVTIKDGIITMVSNEGDPTLDEILAEATNITDPLPEASDASGV